ncbi:hypothetical protein DASC09_009470 [Saccharomycopsis crataegensis]|uniref:F-box domain-containing protein n=1 Tax=Saccharomycopsis crataegensis TaxID=43959 RepID=A0AAV5QG61_9ASCO|nr:hypothetical protein DASC09_009470 [Saccharomycopsis crataegensis]
MINQSIKKTKEKMPLVLDDLPTEILLKIFRHVSNLQSLAHCRIATIDRITIQCIDHYLFENVNFYYCLPITPNSSIDNDHQLYNFDDGINVVVEKDQPSVNLQYSEIDKFQEISKFFHTVTIRSSWFYNDMSREYIFNLEECQSNWTRFVKFVNCLSSMTTLITDIESLSCDSSSLHSLSLYRYKGNIVENFPRLGELQHLSVDLRYDMVEILRATTSKGQISFPKLQSLTILRGLEEFDGRFWGPIAPNLSEVKVNLGQSSTLRNLNGHELGSLKRLELETYQEFDNVLGKFTKLEELKVTQQGEGGGIWDLEKARKSLNKAEFSFSNITVMENLHGLTTLQQLILNTNKIGKIQGLEDLVNLKVLNLSNNCIKKIENLSSLKNLRVLNLRGNMITKMENLDQLRSLVELDLNRNQIKKIENIGRLSKLEVLRIFNTTKTKSEIRDLRMSNHDKLWIIISFCIVLLCVVLQIIKQTP